VAATDEDVLLEHRRRLGGELRRLREQRGLSGRDLAGLIGVSQSKVSRIESSAALPTVPEVISWAKATAATDNDGEMLKILTDAAYAEVHSWDDVLPGRGHLQDGIRDLEDRTGVKRNYSPSLVPGLLQTAEYARRVFTMFLPPYPEQEIPAVIAGRLNRQAALFDPARRFEFLITESALRLRLGPASMMAAQLDRIATLSTLENLDVGLIPQAAMVRTIVPSGFIIFEALGSGLDAFVLTETVHANVTASADGYVKLYRQHWDLLKETALFGNGARDFIAWVAEDMRKLSLEEQWGSEKPDDRPGVSPDPPLGE
jgi:transcriptional regulator with XRE-family HTH domain